jgi:hypothetical protein
MVEKNRSFFVNKTDLSIMLQKLYRTSLQSQLSPAQFLSLEIFVWLLQVHKQVKIERLAAHFPLPILFESLRRHLKRFLKLPVMSIPLIWFPKGLKQCLKIVRQGDTIWKAQKHQLRD